MEYNMYVVGKTACYIMSNIMRKDFNRGNTEFLEMFYKDLCKQNNGRLREKMPYLYELPAGAIRDSLYAAIMDVILDEIVNEKNREIFSLFMEHQMGRFPSIKDDAEKYNTDEGLFESYIKNEPESMQSTEKESRLLYHLLCETNESNINAIIKHYQKELLIYEEDICCTDLSAKLSRMLEIDDLKSNKAYQKFLADQRKTITDYLGIKYGGLERFLLNPAAWNSDCGKDKQMQFICLEENLIDVLLKHEFFMNFYIEDMDEKLCADIINWNFENLCNAMLYDKCFYFKEQPTLNKLISATSMKNPQIFAVKLFLLFHYDLLVEEMEKIIRKLYKNVSFDCMPGADREQELASENSCLRSEVEKLREKLEQQDAAHRKTILKQSKEAKKERHEYEDQIRRLKKQLEAAVKSNCGPCRMPADKEGMPEECVPEEKDKKSSDMSGLSGKKILFLGGSPKTVKKLKKKFSDASFVNEKNASFPDRVDLAVILADFASHSLVQKFKSWNKDAKIMECRFTNVDMIIGKMLQAI